MPSSLTALTGVDVLAHAVEALINKNSNYFSKMVSREAILSVGKYLVRAYTDGKDIEAREGMAWASCMAGIAIAHANPTLPHAIGQAIGGFAHIPHGVSVAANFAEVMRKTYGTDIGIFSEIALLLNSENNGVPSEQLAQQAGREIDILLEKVDCNPKYSDFGVKESDLPHIADIALTNYFTGISLHPFQADKEDIITILKACL